jgi:hypothetical protein
VDVGGPFWLADLLGVLVLVIAAYCLGRVVVWRAQGRPTDVGVDVVHGAMGVGMAAMLVPRLSPVPNVTWAWVFAVAAVWLAGRIVTVSRQAGSARIAQAHYAPHLVMSVAMIYMGVTYSGPARGGPAISGMGSGAGAGAHFPLGALLLALFVFGYAVWLTDQLTGIATVRTWRSAPQLALAGAAGPAAAADGGAPGPAAAASDRKVPLSPRLEAGCHIAMAVTMGYMLILMR